MATTEFYYISVKGRLRNKFKPKGISSYITNFLRDRTIEKKKNSPGTVWNLLDESV